MTDKVREWEVTLQIAERHPSDGLRRLTAASLRNAIVCRMETQFNSSFRAHSIRVRRVAAKGGHK